MTWFAEYVEEALGPNTVYFDEWYEFYLAGHDADLKLQRIYGELSVLAVACISAPYGKKPWTRLEWRAVRDRSTKAIASGDESEEFATLPVRVGDGEVQGVSFSTIAKDIREWPIEKTVDHIINRLLLIRPDIVPHQPDATELPEQPRALTWPIANHTEVRDAFGQLLGRSPPWRALFIRGPSQSGKSFITRQLLKNSIQIPELTCGRFDFKGTTGLDGELRALVQQCDVPLPPSDLPLNERLSRVLDALKLRNRPVLLIFDTFESAGEAQHWVHKQLLEGLAWDNNLRVVITGTKVPSFDGEIWEDLVAQPLQLECPQPGDWFE